MTIKNIVSIATVFLFTNQAMAVLLCSSLETSNSYLQKSVKVIIQNKVLVKSDDDTNYIEHDCVSGVNISRYQYFVSINHPGQFMMELFDEDFNRGQSKFIDGQVRFEQNQLPIKIRCTAGDSSMSLEELIARF